MQKKLETDQEKIKYDINNKTELVVSFYNISEEQMKKDNIIPAKARLFKNIYQPYDILHINIALYENQKQIEETIKNVKESENYKKILFENRQVYHERKYIKPNK